MTNDSCKAGLLGLALLAVLSVICPLLASPRIPLVDPDEGLHAAIAQEMVERGDWMVPRLFNEPFLDKPILYFWAIAASLQVFGMSAAAVRLPGLLLGMFCTLTTAAIAWRMFGRRTGVIAGLLYSSMVLPLALVQLPGHDVALVLWTNLGLFCFWESDGGHSWRRCWAWTAAAGVALGLAVLTKGLAGVAMVGIAYGSYLIISRRLRFVHCWRAVLSLSIAAIIGASWYLAMEQSNPGYLRYYLFERHVLGFFTTSQPHGQAPWWYYIPFLIGGGIPWIAYLPVLVQDTLVRWWRGVPSVTDARGNRPLLFVGCWFVGCMLFLDFSTSKLVTYIWPVFPAMAILAAIVWTRKIEGQLSEGAKRWWGRIVFSTCLLGPLALPVTLGIAENAMPTRFSHLAWTLAIVVGLTSLAPLWGWLRGHDRWVLTLGAATVCGQMLVLLTCALPQVAQGLSGRDLAEYINRSGRLPSRILLTQHRVGSVVFYLDHTLRSRLDSNRMANQDIDDPLPAPILGREEWVVIPERHLATARRDYRLSSLPYEQAGHFRLYHRSDIEPQSLLGQAEVPLLR